MVEMTILWPRLTLSLLTANLAHIHAKSKSCATEPKPNCAVDLIYGLKKKTPRNLSCLI
jgi:hypothetical protein